MCIYIYASRAASHTRSSYLYGMRALTHSLTMLICLLRPPPLLLLLPLMIFRAEWGFQKRRNATPAPMHVWVRLALYVLDCNNF